MGKKAISVVIVFLLMMVLGVPSFAEETLVPINAENFPDQKFRSHVASEFDTDGDNCLSEEEIQAVTSISSSDFSRDWKEAEHDYYGVYSLKGIEYFSNLTSLNCKKCRLTELDVSKNTKLQSLACTGNAIKKLDLSSNVNLKSLDCDNNAMTELNLSGCVNLESVYCRNNALTGLDLSGLLKLRTLVCNNNSLYALSMEHIPAEDFLFYGYGNATPIQVEGETFDLSALPGFDGSRVIYWHGATFNPDTNTLTDIDPVAVSYIYDCGNGSLLAGVLQVQTADVPIDGTIFPDPVFCAYVAEHFDFNGDGMLSLWERDLVQNLEVDGLGITSLRGLEYFNHITGLFCNDNDLTELDLRGHFVTDLWCQSNRIADLKLGQQVYLDWLYVMENPISQLDLSASSEAMIVDCTDCTELQSVVLNENVESLFDFTNSGLREIVLPVTYRDFPDLDQCGQLHQITFLRGCAYLYSGTFTGVEAVAYYPANSTGWTEEWLQDYGGDITWRESPADGHIHTFTGEPVPGDCEQGDYTLFTCACGETYEGDHAPVMHQWDAGTVLDHQNIKRYTCQLCGEEKNYPEGGMFAYMYAQALSFSSSQWYPCVDAGGLYFRGSGGLHLLDMQSGEASLIPDQTSVGYQCDNLLYTSDSGVVTAYDLVSGTVEKTVTLENITTGYQVGVDSQGRIYTGTNEQSSWYLCLFSPDGALLDQISFYGSVDEYCGFAPDGTFFFTGRDSQSWDCKMLYAAKVVDDAFACWPDGKYYVNLGFMTQRENEYHSGCAKLFGDNLLATFKGVVYDISQGLDPLVPVLTVERTLQSNETPSGEVDKTSNGTRMLYCEERNSMIVYMGSKQLAEYDLATGEVLRTYETDHYVYELMWYGDYVVAKERSVTNASSGSKTTYYLEAIYWGDQSADIGPEDLICQVSGHTFSDWTVISEPDCWNGGTKEHTCIHCGYVETRGLSAEGKRYAHKILVQEPTCTEWGCVSRICSCGWTKYSHFTPAAHTWGQWETVVEPTETADGEQQRICTGCSATESRTVAYDPEETLPEETVPEETLPEETVPEETVPGETLPEETVPGETLPEETVPEETVPEETVPEETLPEETVPEETVPEETLPEETVPEETVPEEIVPEETVPEETKPDETLPEVTEPSETPTEPEETEPKEEWINPFEDVMEDKFYYEPVLWAYYGGITTGKDATHFNPSGFCTRSQVVTFLWRAAGQPEPASSENPFPDVPEGKFYTKAVLWAVEQGITAGYKDGTFGPNDACTRGQIVTFLWRYFGEPEPASSENPFPDVVESKFYYKAVLWAVENEITGGFKDGTFGPNKTCTRDQIVTFLYRAMVE